MVNTLQSDQKNIDAFIALTPNSEINILSSLVAEESGVYKTIALVDNEVYTHISQNIGVDTIINKKLIAANNIFAGLASMPKPALPVTFSGISKRCTGFPRILKSFCAFNGGLLDNSTLDAASANEP